MKVILRNISGDTQFLQLAAIGDDEKGRELVSLPFDEVELEQAEFDQAVVQALLVGKRPKMLTVYKSE